MISISSLLNPDTRHSRSSGLIQSKRAPYRAPSGKRWDRGSDFAESKRQHVSFPAYEEIDSVLEREYSQFHVEPVGQITHQTRLIPYRSQKRPLKASTGRDAFEVFSYTFRMPEDPSGESHVVMWDYASGFVRMTSFFKSLGFQKTMPSRLMNASQGLKSVCHNITGGFIGAQGYWMPYLAARAVAATFCWPIRYVLVPIFGYDFPKSCIESRDPAFPRMRISPEIVMACKNALRAPDVCSSTQTRKLQTVEFNKQQAHRLDADSATRRGSETSETSVDSRYSKLPRKAVAYREGGSAADLLQIMDIPQNRRQQSRSSTPTPIKRRRRDPNAETGAAYALMGLRQRAFTDSSVSE